MTKGHLLPEGGYARCGDCAYWAGSDPGFGECRRRAPELQYDFASHRTRATFPQMGDYGWCGEFARKHVERQS